MIFNCLTNSSSLSCACNSSYALCCFRPHKGHRRHWYKKGIADLIQDGKTTLPAPLTKITQRASVHGRCHWVSPARKNCPDKWAIITSAEPELTRLRQQKLVAQVRFLPLQFGWKAEGLQKLQWQLLVCLRDREHQRHMSSRVIASLGIDDLIQKVINSFRMSTGPHTQLPLTAGGTV